MKTDETFQLKPQIEWGDVEPVKSYMFHRMKR